MPLNNNPGLEPSDLTDIINDLDSIALNTSSTNAAANVADGIDTSVDIDTLLSNLTTLLSQTNWSLTQNNIRDAVDASVDIDTILSRLTSIVTNTSGALTQMEVLNAIDGSLDIESIKNSLISLVTNALTQTNIQNAIDASADIEAIKDYLESLATTGISIDASIDIDSILSKLDTLITQTNWSLTQNNIRDAVDASVDIDTIITRLTTLVSQTSTPLTQNQVRDAIDASLDIEAIKTKLDTLVTQTNWSLTEANISNAIDASVDINTIIARLTTLVSQTSTPLTVSDVSSAIDASVDIDTILARLASLVSGQLTVTDTALAVTSGLDASVDIDTIITRLTTLVSQTSTPLTQAQVTAAINASVDVDSLISALTTLSTTPFLQNQVIAGLDNSLDIEALKTKLDTLITQTNWSLTQNNIRDAIDASVDINTLISQTNWSLTETNIANAINSATDIDTIISRLTSITSNTSGALTQNQVRDAIDASLDVEAIKTSLASLVTNALTQTNVQNAIDASTDIEAIKGYLQTISGAGFSLDASIDIDSILAKLDTLITQTNWSLTQANVQTVVDNNIGSTSDVSVPATNVSTGTVKGLLRLLANKLDTVATSAASIFVATPYVALVTSAPHFTIGDQLTRVSNGTTTIWVNDTTQAVVANVNAPTTAQAKPYEDAFNESFTDYKLGLAGGVYTIRTTSSFGDALNYQAGSIGIGTQRITLANDDVLVTNVGNSADTSVASGPTTSGTLKAVIRGFWQGFLDIVGVPADVSIPANNTAVSTVKGLLRLIAGYNNTANSSLSSIDTKVTTPNIRALTSGTDSVSAVQSGTWTVSLPTGASTAANQTTLGAQTTKINDGTNTAAVKPASTAALATDPALVVAVSPNSGLATSALQGTGNTSLSSIDTKLTNAATTTLQTAGNISLSSIDTKLTSGTQLSRVTDGTTTAAVKAASTAPVAADPALVVAVSPNSGLATSALQGTGNTSLSGIDTKLTNVATTTLQNTGNSSLSSIDGKLSNGTQQSRITDGTTVAAVKAASTAAVAADPALVVAISPNNPLTLSLPVGASTAANQTTLGAQTTKINDGTNTAAVKAASTAPVAADPALVVSISPNSGLSTTTRYQAGVLVGGAFSIGDQLTRTVTSTGTVQWTNDNTHAVLTPAQFPNNSQVQPTDDKIIENWSTYLSSLGNGSYPFIMYAAPSTPVNVNSGSASTGTLRVISASNSPDVTSLANIDANITNGTQKSIVRGGAKGVTGAADVTSTAQSADRQALDVQIRTSAGVAIDSFGGGTQFADGAARGTATGTLAMGDDGTNIQSIRVDTAGVLAIQDNGGSITIDATSLPLPTGASTSALQTTGNASLASIDSKLFIDTNKLVITGTDSIGAFNNNRILTIQSAGIGSPSMPVTGSVFGVLQTAAKNVVPQGFPTSTNQSVDRQGLDVQVRTSTGVAVDSFVNTQFADGAARGTATGILTMVDDGTNIQALAGDTTGRAKTVVDSWFGSTAPTVGQKTAANSIPVVLASDNTVTTLPKALTTYVAAVLVPSTLSTTPSDVYVLTGSATKVVKVLSILFSGIATTATNVPVSVVKRSSPNTAGTSIAITAVPLDSASPAATAAAKYYTVNPTLGTAVGYVGTQRAFLGTTTTTNSDEILWKFGEGCAENLVLRGVNESIAVNLNALSIAGFSAICTITWTEE